MLYDEVASFREYLKTKYTFETARTYCNRLENLLQGQNLNFKAENMDISKVMDNLSKIKYKSYFSQSKNAFILFCSFLNVPLNDNCIKHIKIMEAKTKKKYRRMKAMDFKDIDKKIKGLKNQKLKLSYQTILATGLRVSELAQITGADCLFSNDELHFFFIGKGGNAETVKLTKVEYPKLYQDLKIVIQTANANQKIFYSAIYLQINSKELGFKCHDLRRVFANLEYKKHNSKNAVKKKLRHSSIKNTNIYLKNKIKV